MAEDRIRHFDALDRERAKAEAESKVKAEAKAHARAMAEAKTKAGAEAKAKAEAESLSEREAIAKAQVEAVAAVERVIEAEIEMKDAELKAVEEQRLRKEECEMEKTEEYFSYLRDNAKAGTEDDYIVGEEEQVDFTNLLAGTDAQGESAGKRIPNQLKDLERVNTGSASRLTFLLSCTRKLRLCRCVSRTRKQFLKMLSRRHMTNSLQTWLFLAKEIKNLKEVFDPRLNQLPKFNLVKVPFDVMTNQPSTSAPPS